MQIVKLLLGALTLGVFGSAVVVSALIGIDRLAQRPRWRGKA